MFFTYLNAHYQNSSTALLYLAESELANTLKAQTKTKKDLAYSGQLYYTH